MALTHSYKLGEINEKKVAAAAAAHETTPNRPKSKIERKRNDDVNTAQLHLDLTLAFKFVYIQLLCMHHTTFL